ncbi:MAG TPA: hypothetical protein VNG73_00535, partial [Gemmatimonadaceae bacterium]|nr:hypothetical protein [Gemmatimonadaceae bacterium]
SLSVRRELIHPRRALGRAPLDGFGAVLAHALPDSRYFSRKRLRSRARRADSREYARERAELRSASP